MDAAPEAAHFYLMRRNSLSEAVPGFSTSPSILFPVKDSVLSMPAKHLATCLPPPRLFHMARSRSLRSWRGRYEIGQTRERWPTDGRTSEVGNTGRTFDAEILRESFAKPIADKSRTGRPAYFSMDCFTWKIRRAPGSEHNSRTDENPLRARLGLLP